MGDPAEWGRVDDDGTVYVRTPEGERPVGSYPGATPEEALAYFGRKYDELEGQVDLLEQRLKSTDIPPKEALAKVDQLRASVVDAHAVGDLTGLTGRLEGLLPLVESRRAEQDAARAKAREEALAQKERIVAEAEALTASTEWKKSGDRLRALLEEWKAAPRLDRKTDDALWKRFSHARTAFDKSRRAHFATLDSQRDEAAAAKEKIVKEAEALSTSTDWRETATAFRALMDRWKASGRAKRDVDDALWARFRAAQEAFFNARSAVFAERDASLRGNLEKKEALLVEAEALLPVGADPRSARAALRSLHEKWEAAGHVPRSDRDRVEGRLHAVDEAVRAAEESQWRRTNPEARARAEATVSQLQTSLSKLEAELAEAERSGATKKADDARAAIDARRSWLVEAEKTLAEFS
jgi:Domain of Unknown Function (DUF349)